jgi:hypothetical protein
MRSWEAWHLQFRGRQQILLEAAGFLSMFYQTCMVLLICCPKTIRLKYTNCNHACSLVWVWILGSHWGCSRTGDLTGSRRTFVTCIPWRTALKWWSKKKIIRWAGHVARIWEPRTQSSGDKTWRAATTKTWNVDKIMFRWSLKNQMRRADWIHVAQNMEQWRALLNTVVDIRVQ